MYNRILFLTFFLILFCHLINAERFLIVPSFKSIAERKSTERMAKILKSTGNGVSILVHQIDLPNWTDKSITLVTYGNADELRSSITPKTSRDSSSKLLISQINNQHLVKTIKGNHYDTLICNPEDPVCRYIDLQSSFHRRVFLLGTCPRNWEEIFGSLKPQDLLSKIKKAILKWIQKLFSISSNSNELEYQSEALYLSECFQPLYNPEPKLKNMFSVGSFLGDQTKREIPDAYRKPILMANKIVLVSFGADENEQNAEVLLETAKLFPTFLFIITSKTFDIKQYALGNIIIDEDAPLNEILEHSKVAMIISNGEWSILLNALYHNVPAIVLGQTREGAAGRQLVKEKGVGVDLSQKRFEKGVFEEAIRDVAFNMEYKNRLQDIARFLKGLNNNYLIPNLIQNYFSAKTQSVTKPGDL